MPLTMTHEQDNVFRLDLSGQLKQADLDACQHRLKSEIAVRGSVRLLVLLDGFSGWDRGSPWNDLSFYVKHGDAIDRIAIVGDERWRSDMLMFAAADLRKGAVEYFPPGAASEARAWLAS